MIKSEKVNEFIYNLKLKKGFLGGIKEESVYENMRKICDMYEVQIGEIKEQLRVSQEQAEVNEQSYQQLKTSLAEESSKLSEANEILAEENQMLREAKEKLTVETKSLAAEKKKLSEEILQNKNNYMDQLKIYQSKLHRIAEACGGLSGEIGDALGKYQPK